MIDFDEPEESSASAMNSHSATPGGLDSLLGSISFTDNTSSPLPGPSSNQSSLPKPFYNPTPSFTTLGSNHQLQTPSLNTLLPGSSNRPSSWGAEQPLSPAISSNSQRTAGTPAGAISLGQPGASPVSSTSLPTQNSSPAPATTAAKDPFADLAGLF